MFIFTKSFAKIAFFLCTLFCVQTTLSQTKSHFSKERPRSLSHKQIASVILAIQDEIYDYSQQASFYSIGVPVTSSTGRATAVSLYINPHLRADGTGEVIYKNMPYGEIIRSISINDDGMVVLDGGPNIGFPVTQPSHLTVFMNDKELCEDKANWLHGVFIVQDTPSKELVHEASRRQIKRVGFSQFLSSISDPSK